LPDTIDEAGVVKLEPLREWRARGDGESLEYGDGEPCEGVMVALFLLWHERERPSLFFNGDVFGVDVFGVDAFGVDVLGV